MKYTKNSSWLSLFLISILVIITLFLSFGCGGQELSNIKNSDIKTASSGDSQSISKNPKYAPSEAPSDNNASLPLSALGNKPIAVMVENSFAARPQSGLISADVVYEVVDEYGITRFVAIFSSNDPLMVGPVRSARPYYAEIAKGFDSIYAFFGTFPECYKYIQDMGMYTLSAMSDRSGLSSISAQAPYWRDWTRSSIQEHTAFMSVAQLREKAQILGYPMSGGLSFSYKGDLPLDQRGTVSNIHINFATQAYAPAGFDVSYVYNRDTNIYARNMGGNPHRDFNTGQQIGVKNIVVMVTDIQGPLDAYGHMSVRTVGSGVAFIFQDGKAVRGTWERGGVASPFVYKDSSGKIVSFNGGSTWIAMVQGEDKIQY